MGVNEEVPVFCTGIELCLVTTQDEQGVSGELLGWSPVLRITNIQGLQVYNFSNLFT